ncbi:MAG: tRNA glutamyl-Q(34) synthetase GluQRS [Burkholderiaceae bacterium]|nr:tRNA glutamyl-Q(34) synthetase GluQRS [Burkholderiaceae bacterium]
MNQYVGRFAPSPTGELHAGSLACALASFLDARAHNGIWLIRIENIDPLREKPGAIEHQLELLERLEMHSDRPIFYQSERLDAYQKTLKKLVQQKLVYGCSCSRKSIKEQQQLLGLPSNVYPGTCRNRTDNRAIRAWRFKVKNETISFQDRICGYFEQNLEKEVGDFVLKRADGFWAYQLAVVCDDAFQGVNHIVRGQDLLDNTPRQIALQQSLGFSTPSYMHIPLVLGEDGNKLSKQNNAKPINPTEIEQALLSAWNHLGFNSFPCDDLTQFYQRATLLWKEKYGLQII